jgi:hypothetical protein
MKYFLKVGIVLPMMMILSIQDFSSIVAVTDIVLAGLCSVFCLLLYKHFYKADWEELNHGKK